MRGEATCDMGGSGPIDKRVELILQMPAL
jgi:hypothetical protein